MSDSQFKVTDKRMFTAEGELREEYRFLEAEESGMSGDAGDGEPVPPSEPPEVPAEASPSLLPEVEGATPAPGFLDLVGMLAEPVPYYLGEAPLPNGTAGKDLSMARVHIDLLDVLRRKTAGNLTAEESSVLEDILYQLRMRYVQRQG